MAFLNILLFAAGWIGGSFLLGYMLTKIPSKMTATIVYAVIALVIAAVFFLLNTYTPLFVGGGFLVAMFQLANPFELTQEKADEIGKKAAREEAIKKQKEEQKMEEEKRMKENERIYKQAKKEAKAKDKK